MLFSYFLMLIFPLIFFVSVRCELFMKGVSVEVWFVVMLIEVEM